MQPYFNKVTQAGYDQIAAEIEALKQSRPEKKSNNCPLPEHWATSPKTPNIAPPSVICFT